MQSEQAKKNTKSGDEQPVQLEGDNYDERMYDPNKGFMDSEYEVDDEGGLEEDEQGTNEDAKKAANFYFDVGFGLYKGQDIRDTNADYGKSDELQSLDDEEDERTSSRKNLLDICNMLCYTHQ